MGLKLNISNDLKKSGFMLRQSLLKTSVSNFLSLNASSTMSRAFIRNPKFYSTSSNDTVLYESKNGARIFTLNRPKVLNAINVDMIDSILPKLVSLEESNLAKVIILKGNGRSFSSGGDIKAAALSIQDGKLPEVRHAFAQEYRLSHTLATYQKPVVALMNGITMGGGSGLAMHVPFRIACEDTMFAMPETGIGYFTDVAASFFFSRLPGYFGTYLGLTSQIVKGYDCLRTGIATHFVPKHMFPHLEDRLAELNTSDISKINNTILEFAEFASSSPPTFTPDVMDVINKCFCKNDTVDIIRALKEYASNTSALAEFAKSTVKTLYSKSPTSIAVTNRLIKSAAKWSISEAFYYDHIVSYYMLKQPDFVEGVNAQLITKTKNPKWSKSHEYHFKDLENYFKLPSEYNNGISFAAKGRRKTPLWNYKTYPYL
ncbi:mitochondrial ribosomal protein subunit S47/3-hydroxyisobutyryl-CoA hydrolase Snr1 [Schizosaccharomyces pombe]|uniref:Small ribosomal subunit protein mS47 n=1 Tax=Schizosaccharomyces pombe (strain 972 / ATCC 24843) TaxID=284812 RepID=HIBCH_SCHPO|nr:putative 3-hydroxyisobutyryl-CoA hydrolase [Schizosaccharomyces pombe]O74802.1 RecName: Full=Small ribosomal subunit protein mS47; AltName: Full=3-hydroxyisobutyryl-CoA hydrolase, mitochondrial; AltName: Full=3-hydroxyisobutyryl-coenzyme A hydrolase; Short=HIB-CoA hydrolase; Short=HIBYL-CoA-H [Schizosaccharomyces pombe 972h-]CAA21167.1 3-hydroxyisobutyryl-CoA hydrolase (predicted) [Schizosaccharomyces pombe]|eukprot:NP_596228.1 putative 3-hydroxyisobutyryl-CoA hydrolase [Schizosaccharomyces pombe]